MFNYNALTGISPNALMPQTLQAGPQGYSSPNYGWNAPSAVANPAYRPAPMYQPPQAYYGGGRDDRGPGQRWDGGGFSGMNWDPQGGMFDPRYYGPQPQLQMGPQGVPQGGGAGAGRLGGSYNMDIVGNRNTHWY